MNLHPSVDFNFLASTGALATWIAPSPWLAPHSPTQLAPLRL